MSESATVEAAPTGATAQPAQPSVSYTPETALAERTSLIADAGFRARYMSGGKAEQAHMERLNLAIAEGMAAPDDQQQGQPPIDQVPALAPIEGDFAPPASPTGYKLATDFAKAQGLQLDPFKEIEIRQELHAAGFDEDLAAWTYHAAVTGAAAGHNEVKAASERISTENALQQAWGDAYGANVELARQEAERLFAAIPASITCGETFETFVETRGLGNNRRLIEILLARAQARKR